MKSQNLVLIIGNVTRDPEVKTTSNGVKLATFAVATNRVWKNKTTGEKEEEAEFHNCVAWASLADLIAQYVKKGSPIHVSGYLKTKMWQDEGSEKKNYRTEIVCNDIILLSSRQDATPAPAKDTEEESTTAFVPPPEYKSEVSVEDLPF